mgnify:CR=1 FL=1
MSSQGQSVTLCATSIFDKLGGVQTYMRLLIRALGDSGRLAQVISYHDSLKDERALDWAQVYEFDYFGANSSSALFASELIRSDLHSDFLLLGHLSLVPAGWLLAEVLGQASDWGVVLHGVEAWEAQPATRQLAFDSRPLFISTTEYTAREFASTNNLANPRSGLLPLAIEPGRFEERCAEARTPEASLRILTVGRLGVGEQYKGVDHMIHAVNQAHAEGVDVEYIVIGDGKDRQRLETIVKDVDAGDVVEFLGHVSDRRLIEEFERADVFAMPSSGEGFGLVYLEAMHYGLPLIASPEGGASHVIRDQVNGLEVQYGDVRELANAIIDLQDSDVRLRLSRGAKHDVEERFSFERFREDLLRILDSGIQAAGDNLHG